MVLHTNYRSIHVCRLSTDQVGLSNNNPHWNLGFWFLFFPDLIQVFDSLERLESNSSKSWEMSWWQLVSVLTNNLYTEEYLYSEGLDRLVLLFPRIFYRRRRRRFHLRFDHALKIINITFVYSVWSKGWSIAISYNKGIGNPHFMVPETRPCWAYE